MRRKGRGIEPLGSTPLPRTNPTAPPAHLHGRCQRVFGSGQTAVNFVHRVKGPDLVFGDTEPLDDKLYDAPAVSSPAISLERHVPGWQESVTHSLDKA
eukprot:3262521-Rhodomonas_salina.1